MAVAVAGKNRRMNRQAPHDFERPVFILRKQINKLTHPEIIRHSQSQRESPLGFRVNVNQKGEFKFELEVAYYEKENIIIFMYGLPGPEIEPTDPEPGDVPQQTVLRALNEWGKSRRFK